MHLALKFSYILIGFSYSLLLLNKIYFGISLLSGILLMMALSPPNKIYFHFSNTKINFFFFTFLLLLSCSTINSIILLIIIAHCKYLIKNCKRKPILLFDEVCSHLDTENRKLLIQLIEILNVQIFLTGTEKDFFSFLSTKASYCNINKK